jgi:hypothetical protein
MLCAILSSLHIRINQVIFMVITICGDTSPLLSVAPKNTWEYIVSKNSNETRKKKQKMGRPAPKKNRTVHRYCKERTNTASELANSLT